MLKISMLKIFKNIFFFKVAKTNTKKAKKGKVVVVNTNIGDRKLSMCKTIKYQLNIEKKV